jgi:ribosome biogenesis protein YTM1
VRKEGISTENAIEVLYFPARRPPVKEGEGTIVPDWIACMDHCREGALFAGCADGMVRRFECNGGEVEGSGGVRAHAGSIRCLSAMEFGDDGASALVATGSMDQTLVTHLSDTKSNECSLDLHAVYSGGHSNSIGSVALCNNNGEEILMASGDWDGGLVVWDVPGRSAEDNDDTAEESNSKRQKGSRHRRHGTKSKVLEIKPKASTKAHTSNISGLSFGHASPSTLLTSSWDHSLKVYDLERMDCVLTTNGSRVITSLSRCTNGNVVGTGCADNMVRLWDMRVGGGGVGGMGQVADKTLRQRLVKL